MGLPEYVKTDWDNKFRQEKHKVRPGLWTVANEGREDLPNNAIKVFLRQLVSPLNKGNKYCLNKLELHDKYYDDLKEDLVIAKRDYDRQSQRKQKELTALNITYYPPSKTSFKFKHLVEVEKPDAQKHVGDTPKKHVDTVTQKSVAKKHVETVAQKSVDNKTTAQSAGGTTAETIPKNASLSATTENENAKHSAPS